MSNMEEKQKQTQTPDLDSQIQEAVDLANSTQADRRQTDEQDFLRNVAERARSHVEITKSDSDAESIPVTHSGVGKKIAAASIAAGVVIGGGAAAAGPIGDVIDQHFSQIEENNKRWSEEAENARHLQEQDLDSGKITIDVKNPTQESDQ